MNTRADLPATIYNFSAGPAMLPLEVMQQANAEFLNWQGTGVSVLEISHRSPQFMAMVREAEQDLRDLYRIPDNYHVLFVHGGARHQFSMVPMNLLRNKTTADYLHTGYWSQQAINEAQRYATVNVAMSGEASNYTSLPEPNTWQLDPSAAYVHYTANETVGGLEFDFIPETGEVPLVTDMSSNILSCPLDISRFGLIYACAQKNISSSGLTIVIVRKDLVGQTVVNTPTMFDYRTYAENGSLYNTPANYPLYLSALVFKWLKQQGGLEKVAAQNHEKSSLLYQAIDESNFYHNTVEPRYRSTMNVVFRLPNDDLHPVFLEEASKAGLRHLKGHSAVGGLRASVYNAMPRAGVERLINFMQEFAHKHEQ